MVHGPLGGGLEYFTHVEDVVIEYEPINETSFHSTVYYKSKGKQSTVKGTETLSQGMNGANFDWKGAGWLFFVHSHWEVLGYGRDENSEWAVTFFSKTLFTPAGIDVYVRSVPEQAKQGLVDSVVDKLKQNGDEGVRMLSEKGFYIPSC